MVETVLTIFCLVSFFFYSERRTVRANSGLDRPPIFKLNQKFVTLTLKHQLKYLSLIIKH